MESMTMSMESMPMASATSSMAHMMPMPTDGSTSAPMEMTMVMTFFTSSTTPLFTKTWTPTSAGQYAGTCIFLIAFAAIFRALLAVRFNYDHILAAINRGRGDDQIFLYSDETKPGRRPWRAKEAVTLAAMDVLIAAVSYLLMIAVMTMNVGYFLSVLAGIFVGSLAFSRFMARSTAH